MAAKKRGLAVALIAILVLAAAAAGAWMMLGPGFGAKTDEPGNTAADQPLTAPLPADPGAAPPPAAPAADSASADAQQQFDRAAVIDDPNGYTNVHNAPSPMAPIVARVSAGETFSTYDQGSDWWRVRTTGGLIGYMPRSRIALRGAAPPPAAALATAPGEGADGNQMAAAGPPTATQPRRPPRPRSRINRANSANMRAFCQNAGRGTPQCRQFRRDSGGR